MIMNQFIANKIAFKNRLNIIDIVKAKILAVERFNSKKVKLKGFLT